LRRATRWIASPPRRISAELSAAYENVFRKF
jgi:hypothetical protein